MDMMSEQCYFYDDEHTAISNHKIGGKIDLYVNEECGGE
jgi:hypothetical protein